MTRLIIVCGLPGTGKTTFAETLSKRIHAIHLNTDRIRHAIGRQGQYSIALKATIYESLLLRSKEALFNKTNGFYPAFESITYPYSLDRNCSIRTIDQGACFKKAAIYGSRLPGVPEGEERIRSTSPRTPYPGFRCPFGGRNGSPELTQR
jgi:hypothetical protein